MLELFPWIIVFWFFLVGGAIGSFLNVVVYRLPRGERLTHPPSHCPRCGHAIRWHDNLPVLGWLLLKGKCRDCRLPIAIRYPIVEGVAAVLFGSVALRWIFAGEQVWPVRPRLVRGDVFLPPLSEFEVLMAACWVLVLLTTLLSAGLIEWDRQRIPLRLFFPAILVGLVAPCIWPFLHPVSLLPFSFIAERTAAEHFPFLYRPENTVVVILLEQMAGIVAGGCVGWLLARLLKSGKAGGHRIGAGRVKELVEAQRIWSFSLALVGLFLGWQVVVPAAVSLLAIEGVLRILGRKGLFILELCGVVFLLVVGRDLLWVEHFF